MTGESNKGDKIPTPYQRKPYACPLCHGNGVKGHAPEWLPLSATDDAKEITCNGCGGSGIVWG